MGQLGNDDDTHTSTNVPVEVSGIGNATNVAAGSNHTCARLDTGSVACWGFNYFGQLGDAGNTDSNVPVTVSGIGDAVMVDANGSFSCVVLFGGSVECWGYNGTGQLGNGSTTDSNVPVEVTGISNAISVSLGNEFACALLDTGAIQCWGANGYGQLGNGDDTLADTSTPVDVTGLINCFALAAGGNHVCALGAGEAHCWGSNSSTQLGNGDGSVPYSNVPIPVFGMH
jgi:alpha-tubulin suppressor-like RCC1 family protein